MERLLPATQDTNVYATFLSILFLMCRRVLVEREWLDSRRLWNGIFQPKDLLYDFSRPFSLVLPASFVNDCLFGGEEKEFIRMTFWGLYHAELGVAQQRSLFIRF